MIQNYDEEIQKHSSSFIESFIGTKEEFEPDQEYHPEDDLDDIMEEEQLFEDELDEIGNEYGGI